MEYRASDEDDEVGGAMADAVNRAQKDKKRADQQKALNAQRKRAGILIHITAPRDPQAFADVLAALVRADLRAGVSVSLDGVKYRRERGDWWDAPDVVRWKGFDDCDGLVRAAAADPRVEYVACVAAPQGGWHVFLLRFDGSVFDPCVAAGMPQPPMDAYSNPSRSRVRPRVKLPPKVLVRRLLRRGSAGQPGPLVRPESMPPLTDLQLRELERELDEMLLDFPEQQRDRLREVVLAELQRALAKPPAVAGHDDGEHELDEDELDE
ncbi:MAG TPA: hypothetical protein VLS46_04765, partial [Gaiellaceae bacterium]|nr:hypothetical protein [Gaiellaceae bacterium]